MEQPSLVLCGGTFFYLLLQVRKPGVSSKEHTYGTSNAFTESNVLSELVKVVNPDFTKPIAKSTASNYKNCTNQFNSLLGKSVPQNQPGLIIEAFDNRIKAEYTSCLADMEKFVAKYIVSSSFMLCDFVRAILEIIWEDGSIQSSDLFFVCEDGLPLKEKISAGTELNVYLPAFLLGIWHFIVVNRKDNRIGAAILKSWDEPQNEQDSKNIFKRIIGQGYCDKISIKFADNFDRTDCKSSTGVVSSGDSSDSGLHVVNQEAGSQNNTVAGSMRRLFCDMYSDYHIDVFLSDGLENRINSDLLPWVDRFIEHLEQDILQGYIGILLDNDALMLQSTIRRYINALSDYKNDLIRYVEERNRNWYLPKPDIPLFYDHEFNPANISAIRDAMSGKVTRKKISIEDSLEHNRKSLDRLYKDIVTEV